MTVRGKQVLIMLATAGLAGCGGGSSQQEPTGYLSLGVSDAPLHSTQKVCITFDDVELKRAGDGPPFLVDLPQTKVNLLDFQGMNAAPLLFNEEVPAGEYLWMRLVIDASQGGIGGQGDSGDPNVCDGAASYFVMDDENTYNIVVPSGDQNGLKMIGGFTVPVNASADFTAEWDMMQSMTEPPGLSPDVIVRPVIKLVNNAEVGALSGRVSADLAAAAGCEPAVFVFDNADPDQSDVGVSDIAATGIVAPVDNADGTTGYEYEIGFLLAGEDSYEAAFTCDGMDFVEPDEGMNPFDIVAGEMTVIDFL